MQRAREEREAGIAQTVTVLTGSHHERIARLRADLARIPTFDPDGEREVRAALLAVDEQQRAAILRENADSATAMAAVVNSPLRIVTDSLKADALANYNRHHRANQLAELSQHEFVVAEFEEIAGTVLREMNEIAPRPL
jgi:hypothetical protein